MTTEGKGSRTNANPQRTPCPVNGVAGPPACLTALPGQDVFFVSCEWGSKKPVVTYVERPFEGTKTEAYESLFVDCCLPGQSLRRTVRDRFRPR